MDPTLTKADAHRIFGELYRKSRPPELQEKIDRVVTETSDVFVRIKRIEELDNEESRKARLAREDDPAALRRPSGGGGGGSSGAGTGTTARKPAPKKQRSGFLSQLFGGDLAKWGKETGTLNTGFLSLNPRISNKVDDLFRALPEEDIVAALKCFRFVARHAWESWDPRRYNTVTAAHLFFIEFANVRNLVVSPDNPNMWITQTLKMQKYYALLQMHPEYKQILLEDFTSFVKGQDDVSPQAAGLRRAMDFIAKLDNRVPSFKNAILAYYAMLRRSVPRWDELLVELQVKTPNLKTYRAPEDILKNIRSKMSKLKEKVAQLSAQVAEIQEIKKTFFSFDGTGKLQVDFLNPIVDDVIRRTFPESMINEALMKTHKREPHRLLFVAMKDLDISAMVLLQGSVSVRATGVHQQDVILFKPGLFSARIEAFSNLFRELDQYIKKYKNMTYTFNAFVTDVKKQGLDAVLMNFVQIVRSANAIFAEFATDLRIVLDNHEHAHAAERTGKLTEKLTQSKSIPIEVCTSGTRFIPHASAEVVSSGRYNGGTVEAALKDIVRNLYNYLYIFRYEELIRTLSSVPPLQAEINSSQAELARMGVSSEETATET